MGRKYKLEVVKGDRVIQIVESNNHISQVISEIEFDNIPIYFDKFREDVRGQYFLGMYKKMVC